MEMPVFKIKRPRDCTKDELKQFYKLVAEGGQVNTEGLDKKILECKFLGFCYVGEELASIAAIKIKPSDQISQIFTKAKARKTDNLPILELGYCFTNHHHRGKKYNSTLNDKVLEKIQDKNVFATTGNPIMIHYFEDRGFKLVGEPYPGNFSPLIYVYAKSAI